jgi:hypothetical protein
VPSVTKAAIVAVTVTGLLIPAAGGARPAQVVRCETLVSSQWTHYARDGGVARGQRYRVEAERLPCFLAVRLATQLIPLRTKAAFAQRRPAGFLCLPLAVGANRYRPATAVGLCLQKPVARTPGRSFSWHPLTRD